MLSKSLVKVGSFLKKSLPASAAAIIMLLLCSISGAQSTSAISLVQGWNLVSLPLEPANASIASVLSGINGAYEAVWAYPNQTWKVYDPKDSGGSTLTNMQAGNGYWIKMTSAKTLSVTGSAASSSPPLLYGWNLVGYNGTSCVAPSSAFSSISSSLQLLVSWGYPGQVWQFYDPNDAQDSTLNQLCPGAGYWINVCQAGTWPPSAPAPADEWTWMSGSNTGSQTGVYGAQGVPAPGNVPGARQWAVSWTDPQGSLWLFGGNGYDSAGNYGDLNDLWKFDGTNWTWALGSNIIDQSGVYGAQGVAAPGNAPGARWASISWTDPQGSLWLFGGNGYDSAGNLDELNDLWRYKP